MADNTSEKVTVYSADISQLTTTFNELMQQITATREELKGLKAGTAEYNAVAQKLTNQEKQLARAFKDGTVQIDKNSVSYRQLNDVLKDLKKSYREVGTEQERSEITDGIQAFDKELKSLDANIGNFHRSVGNYGGALANVGDVLLSNAANLDLVDNKTASLFIKLFKDIPKLTSALNNLNNTTKAAGAAAEKAGADSVAALSKIISRLGAVAIALGAAFAVYKMFQSEIDRGLRHLKDWGKELLGIEEYTINNAKAQEQFADALKESTSQIAGQIATYKILNMLVNNYLMSEQNSEKAASELLKAMINLNDEEINKLKLVNDEQHRTNLLEGQYKDVIEQVTNALYDQAKAGAVVKFMTEQINTIIDMQNQITQLNLKRNQAVEDQEKRRIRGFWNWMKVGFIGASEGTQEAIDMVLQGAIDNIDADKEELEKKIKELEESLPQQFADLMEALFPDDKDGEAGSGPNRIIKALFGDVGGPGDNAWYSKVELTIKEVEAMQEDYWKYSKAGYAMYLKMYDEIADHYKNDEKKYREALANKKAFQKQYLDYHKKLLETEADYGQGQMQKDINALEIWHKEQVKLYDKMGMDKTNLEAEYANRRLKIDKSYEDKYEMINKRHAEVIKKVAERQRVVTEEMKKSFQDIEKTIKISTRAIREDGGLIGFFDVDLGKALNYYSKLKKATVDVYDFQKEQINAETEMRKAELEKQRDDELVALKEKLGDTEEYNKQKLSVETYYNNQIVDVELKAQAEIEGALRGSLKRQLDYLSDYYETRRRQVAFKYEGATASTAGTSTLSNIDIERNDWNGGWGSIGQTTEQDINANNIEKLKEQYELVKKEIEEKQEAIREILTNSEQLTVEERLSYEEEYVNLANQLEDARLEHQQEVNQLMLENDKQKAADRVQAWQESFKQVSNLLNALNSAYEADVKAQLARGEITEEAAEKELEKFKYVKAAAAAIDALGSAVGAYNSMASIPYVGPALGAIAAAAALAAGYANVKQILNTTKDNAGSGGGTQYQSVTPSQADFNPAYVTNVTGQQETEQLANAISETPIWVSVQDINDAQDKNRVRVQETTF